MCLHLLMSTSWTAETQIWFSQQKDRCRLYTRITVTQLQSLWCESEFTSPPLDPSNPEGFFFFLVTLKSVTVPGRVFEKKPVFPNSCKADVSKVWCWRMTVHLSIRTVYPAIHSLCYLWRCSSWVLSIHWLVVLCWGSQVAPGPGLYFDLEDSSEGIH